MTTGTELISDLGHIEQAGRGASVEKSKIYPDRVAHDLSSNETRTKRSHDPL
jgi:hypothetical protein